MRKLEMKRLIEIGVKLGMTALAIGSVAALCGCSSQEAAAQGQPAPVGGVPAAPSGGTEATFQLAADVPGVPVGQIGDPDAIRKVVASRTFNKRGDPFELFPSEKAFESSQRAESLLQSVGGWSVEYKAPPETGDEDQLEPQPYRRLAGVLVGDTVAAIIVMENGATYIVKPGMKIPNSEWTVVSIDMDRAVLRREGNKKPNQITVRLETPPGGGGGGGAGGRPGGNAPGPGQGGGAGNQGGGGRPGQGAIG